MPCSMWDLSSLTRASNLIPLQKHGILITVRSQGSFSNQFGNIKTVYNLSVSSGVKIRFLFLNIK